MLNMICANHADEPGPEDSIDGRGLNLPRKVTNTNHVVELGAEDSFDGSEAPFRNRLPLVLEEAGVPLVWEEAMTTTTMKLMMADPGPMDPNGPGTPDQWVQIGPAPSLFPPQKNKIK